MPNSDPQGKKPESSCKREWASPTITDLPRLVDLTLQTGPGIPGGFSIGRTQVGGSTVIP